ncbi:MAG: protein kinase [Planctomycetota bacterium]
MSDPIREAEQAVLASALAQGLVKFQTVREAVLLRADLQPSERPETVLSILPLSVKETKAFLALHAQHLTPGPPAAFTLSGARVKRAEELAKVPRDEDPPEIQAYLTELEARVADQGEQRQAKERAKAQKAAEDAARAEDRAAEAALQKARDQIAAEVEAHQAKARGEAPKKKAPPTWAKDALAAHGGEPSAERPAPDETPPEAKKKATPSWAKDALAAHGAEPSDEGPVPTDEPAPAAKKATPSWAKDALAAHGGEPSDEGPVPAEPAPEAPPTSTPPPAARPDRSWASTSTAAATPTPAPTPTPTPAPTAPTATPEPPVGAPREDPTKRTQVGRYPIERVVAQGMVGVVYRARDPQVDEPVAIKLLHPSHTSDAYRRQFRLGVENQARLEHKHVLRVREFGAELGGLGDYYAVYDWVEGETLAARNKRGCPSTVEAASLAHSLAAALVYAHARGTLHLDVKPQNVILGPQGPLLTDFGMPRSALPGGVHLLGTPHYMSPEQAREEVESLDRKSDVYGLGAVLYELLTGQPPFVGSDPEAVVDAIVRGPLQPPSALAPGVPRDLETICLRCLERDPHDRYPSARQLAEDLALFLGNRPILSERPPLRVRFRRWRRRNRGTLVGVFLLLLIGAGVAVWQLDARRRSEVARARKDATEAWQALDRHAREDPPPHRIDLALSTLDAISTWQGREWDPREAQLAQSALVRTTLTFARFAEERDQLDLARGLYARAVSLGDPDGSARQALDRLDAAHAERLAAHRARVDALLRRVSDSQRIDATTLDEAFTNLLAVDDRQSLERFVGELDALTAELQQVEQELLADTARPTPAESAQGQLQLQGLPEALAARYAAPESELEPQHQAPLAQARARLGARLRAALGERAPTARERIGQAQSERLGPGRRALSRLLCRALAAAPLDPSLREDALRATLAFASLANAPRLAGPALVAACQLGGDRPDVRATLRARCAELGARSLPALLVEGTLAELEETAGPATVDTRLAQGRLSLALGDGPGAARHFQKALELGPEGIAARVGLAQAQLAAGDLEGAWQTLELALQRAPERADVWTLRGQISLRRGELGKVGPAVSRAIELDADYAPAYLVRAQVRTLQGQHDLALADADQAARLAPTDAQALALRARIQLARERPDDALLDAERALAVDPEAAAGYLARARVALGPGLPEPRALRAAHADLGRALERDPELAEAWALRGRARHLLGDVVGARRDLEHALRLEALPEAWIALARVQLDQGEPEQARESLGRSLALAERPEVFAERARLAMDAGDTVSALRDLESALRLRRDDVPLLMQRARVLLQAGDSTRAALDLHEVLRLAPGTPEAADAQRLLDGGGR